MAIQLVLVFLDERFSKYQDRFPGFFIFLLFFYFSYFDDLFWTKHVLVFHLFLSLGACNLFSTPGSTVGQPQRRKNRRRLFFVPNKWREKRISSFSPNQRNFFLPPLPLPSVRNPRRKSSALFGQKKKRHQLFLAYRAHPKLWRHVWYTPAHRCCQPGIFSAFLEAFFVIWGNFSLLIKMQKRLKKCPIFVVQAFF